MLRMTEIQLQVPKGSRVSGSMGSIMQGALMDIVDTDTAERLHDMSVRPYSQCIYYDKARHVLIWRIGTLSDSAYEAIVKPVLQCGGEIYLRQKRYAVGLKKATLLQQTSYDALADRILEREASPDGAALSFLTTTSFKHNGRYEIFPVPQRIFYSLLCRWNTYAPLLPMDQGGVEKMFAENCHISRYDMRSQGFSLEGQTIFGFCGTLTLRFHVNEMANRLMGVLLQFAPYAGVGMKPALGMGALDTKLMYT
jgi:CRISPR-associated endoribonuclease Cas6